MTTSIPIRRESLQRQLEIHRNNLAALEEQAASYGLQIPLNVVNEIDHARREIEKLEQLLAQNNGSNVEMDIDSGYDALLSAMVYIQRRMEKLLTAVTEDRARVEVLWRRAHPSLKHRLAISTAVGFLVMTASLWYVKDFRDVLLSTPAMALLITAALLTVAPMVYLFGRDDPND